MTPTIHGLLVDGQTRCEHYASARDVVAIRCFCCDAYYACCRCHDALADHALVPWPADRLDVKAVMCGVCQHEMSIRTYLAVTACPHCHAAFNPGCSAHHRRYFDLPPDV